MPRYPTDKQLAMAVEKIMAAVRDSIANFKAAAPALAKTLSDDEWTKLKRDEDRRRQAMKKIPKQALKISTAHRRAHATKRRGIFSGSTIAARAAGIIKWSG
jgi:Skp family chaperone for outer membrane proteins